MVSIDISKLATCMLQIPIILLIMQVNYIAMWYMIYFIVTADAPSAFRLTHYQVTHYFNQLVI